MCSTSMSVPSLTLVCLFFPTIAPASRTEFDNPPPLPSVKNSTPSAEVRGAVAKGRSLRNAGDYAGARAALDATLKQARDTKDTAGEALALNNLASIYRYEAGLALITANQTPPSDLVAKSIDLYEQALKAARSTNDKSDEAYATLYLGVLAAGRGDSDKAFQHYKTALESYKALDERYYTARTLMFMGSTMLHRRNDPEASLKYFEQSLPLFREAKYWNEAQWVLDDMKLAYQALIVQRNGQR